VTPLAVGIDLVEVRRVQEAIERTPQLEQRAFTASEIRYCRAAQSPWQRFAARWAAKEAVVKCLGGGVPGFELTDIEVVHDADGAPMVRLSGRAADRARDRGIDRWLLSMTHVAEMAQATAIGLGDSGRTASGEVDASR